MRVAVPEYRPEIAAMSGVPAEALMMVRGFYEQERGRRCLASQLAQRDLYEAYYSLSSFIRRGA